MILSSTGTSTLWIASSTYILASASTSLAYIPFASSTLYVPYTGATGNVDLNTKSLTNVSILGVNAGGSYQYNGQIIAQASTTLFNYFFGNSGNLTMTGNYN